MNFAKIVFSFADILNKQYLQPSFKKHFVNIVFYYFWKYVATQYNRVLYGGCWKTLDLRQRCEFGEFTQKYLFLIEKERTETFFERNQKELVWCCSARQKSVATG